MRRLGWIGAFLLVVACDNDPAEPHGLADAGPDAPGDGSDADAGCPFGECAFVESFVDETTEYPGGWTDCKTADDSFDALELVDGGLAVPAPDKGPGGEDIDHWFGIGCAYRDFGTASGTFGVTHTGHGDGQHVEATPLLHIVEGTTKFGFGIWPATLYDTTPVWFVGYIGKPPTEFNVTHVGVGQGMPWVSGMHTDIEITTNGEYINLYWNGVLQKVHDPSVEGSPEITDIPVPEELRGSTKHGFALDAHLAPNRYTAGLTHFWYDPERKARHPAP